MDVAVEPAVDIAVRLLGLAVVVTSELWYMSCIMGALTAKADTSIVVEVSVM